MSKLIVILSALLVTQAGNAMTSHGQYRVGIGEAGDSALLYVPGVLTEMHRQEILAELRQSLKSPLIVEFRPGFIASEPFPAFDNRQF